jgi:hypothetical protein
MKMGLNRLLGELLCCLACALPVHAQYTPPSVTQPAAIAERVRQVGYPKGLSLPALSARLTQGLSTEQDKLYAIYLWVSSNIDYDAAAYFSGNFRDVSGAQRAYERGLGVCDGYADLVYQLGTAAGLKIEMIEGYGKGFEYSTGKTPGSANHAWNAVWLDGRWFLMDATWDAGAVDKRTRQFVRNQRGLHYFLADPSFFATSHFPTQPRWQLQNRQRDFAEFLSLVEVSPEMRQWGLDLSRHLHHEIAASSSVMSFDFGRQVPFLSAQLEVQGQRIPGNWSLHVRSEMGDSRLLVAAPQAGRHTVEIHVMRNAADPQTLPIIEYSVQFPAAASSAQPFPTTFTSYLEKDIRLTSPVQGTLAAGVPTQFRLAADGATSLELFHNGKPIKTLTKDGRIHSAVVELPPGEVYVFAMYPNASQYTGLLKYQVR